MSGIYMFQEAKRQLGTYIADSYEGVVTLPISFASDLRSALEQATSDGRRLLSLENASLHLEEENERLAEALQGVRAECKECPTLIEEAQRERIEQHILLWSMRPTPGTPSGEAWEAGARQGWQWAHQLLGHYLKQIDAALAQREKERDGR